MHTLTRVQKSPRGKFSRNTFTPKENQLRMPGSQKGNLIVSQKIVKPPSFRFVFFSFGGGGGHDWVLNVKKDLKSQSIISRRIPFAAKNMTFWPQKWSFQTFGTSIYEIQSFGLRHQDHQTPGFNPRTDVSLWRAKGWSSSPEKNPRPQAEMNGKICG